MNKVKLTIGDWSKDGHNHYEILVYESNKTCKEIQDAYKASCKLTGLQFNHNEEYTDIKLGYGHPRQICTEYEDASISEEAQEILAKYGFSDEILNGGEIIDEEHFAELIIKFIKLSLPDLQLEEASYKRSELDGIEAINGWWNKELNCQFGYGLFND